MMLYPPAGAELFRCPCGQVLRNPYYQRPPTASQTNKKYMSDEEIKSVSVSKMGEYLENWDVIERLYQEL